MKLTKKYRIWWNTKKEIQNDYLQDYSNSITYGSTPDFTYFEADTLEEIEEIINKYKLKIQKND